MDELFLSLTLPQVMLYQIILWTNGGTTNEFLATIVRMKVSAASDYHA